MSKQPKQPKQPKQRNRSQNTLCIRCPLPATTAEGYCAKCRDAPKVRRRSVSFDPEINCDSNECDEYIDYSASKEVRELRRLVAKQRAQKNSTLMNAAEMLFGVTILIIYAALVFISCYNLFSRYE